MRRIGPERKRPAEPPAARCAHFGICGGCDALDRPYSEQLDLKSARLRSFLGDLLPTSPTDIQVLPAPRPYHYRNKVIYPVHPRDRGAGREAGIATGFYRRGTHELVRIEDCSLQEPCLTQLLEEMREAAEELALSAYDERSGEGFVRSLFARLATGTGELMVGICTKSGLFERSDAFVRLVEARARGLRSTRGSKVRLVSIMRSLHDAEGNRLLGLRNFPLKGREFLKERLGKLQLRIGLGSFYQVNPTGTIRLYQLVEEMLGEREFARALECYSGIGSLSLWLGSRLREVWNIESSQSAVRDARENFTAARRDPGLVLEGLVEERLVEIPGALDLILLDPPRAGLSPSALEAVLARSAPDLIYVSCNPDTFLRDARAFLVGGYRLEKLAAVDLFPHTQHVELVAHLARTDRAE